MYVYYSLVYTITEAVRHNWFITKLDLHSIAYYKCVTSNGIINTVSVHLIYISKGLVIIG